MKPEELAFLEAVIANPDEDDTRLIYADWLEEQGDSSRAEFIRAQITLAQPNQKNAQRKKAERRSRQLEKTVAKTWSGLVDPSIGALFHPGEYGFQIAFERGFPTSVSACLTHERGNNFSTQVNLLFARAPIQRLVLYPSESADWYGQRSFESTSTATLRRFLTPSVLGRLVHLKLNSPFTDIDEVGRLLVELAHLKDVREIHLHNVYAAPEWGGSTPDELWSDTIDTETKTLLWQTFGPRISWERE